MYRIGHNILNGARYRKHIGDAYKLAESYSKILDDVIHIKEKIEGKWHLVKIVYRRGLTYA